LYAKNPAVNLAKLLRDRYVSRFPLGRTGYSVGLVPLFKLEEGFDS